ncbi:DUF4234 domain-containing protein [Salinarchaeum sp. IM2453]|uniref:DUF4234 domain-containing protein n=1 Tax=Salinarchaeum sp. IM2453 TaxID=2862870 RepID=UPI001C82E5FC|nr:DUF4234 domain-containing protein [Salinarchaeum sp. IM2453]QZA88382.1 DUF4234 domain-containing protein [Salinarchaeum sp. IM2453]
MSSDDIETKAEEDMTTEIDEGIPTEEDGEMDVETQHSMEAEKDVANYLERRQPWFVIVASFITLGIYFLYWFYKVNSQMKAANGDESSPGLRTIGLFVPILNIVILWWTARSIGRVIDERDELAMFLAVFVFLPAFLGVVQGDINAVIDGRKK